MIAADLVYGVNDSRRAGLRIQAAFAYANAGQFDDAEALIREAIAVEQHLEPKQPGSATQALQSILQMKRAAQPVSALKQ